jgi:hypothetical protein
MRDGRLRAREDGLGVNAGSVAAGNGAKLHVATRGHEDRIEVSLDRLITRAEHAEQDIVCGLRLLNRAAEDEVLAHVDLDLSVGVVDLEHRARFHDERAVERVNSRTAQPDAGVRFEGQAPRAAWVERQEPTLWNDGWRAGESAERHRPGQATYGGQAHVL